MKVAAIIAEYNPFHNGHKYQIQNIRSLGYKAIIVLMSSSFVQRGEPAIFDKWTRAEAALRNGADLILELPHIYSTSNAEIFAKGAIHLLKHTPMTDLFFGAEDSMESLLQLQHQLRQIPLHRLKYYLNQGYSHIKARELSLREFLSPNEILVLKQPNNILALEYLKYLPPSVKAHAMPRKSVHHKSLEPKDHMASATLIRQKIRQNKDFAPYVPVNLLELYKTTIFNDWENYKRIVQYALLKESHKLSRYYDYEPGLENRLTKFRQSSTLQEIITKSSSKRYTKSRISRLLLSLLLDNDRHFIEKSFTTYYLRVLGMNSTGAGILRSIQKNYQVINRFARIQSLEDPVMTTIAKKEAWATDLYNLMGGISEQDYYQSPLFKETDEV
ncbi:MAG: nucleotidyltransferase family protein [Tissierellia bacterium]|nr:nucleotidyltransferase family protein [Tissierellia bacterium]